MTEASVSELTEHGASSGCCMPARDGLVEAAAVTSVVEPVGPTRADGMVLLPGGTFLMGTDDAQGYPADGEGPVRQVQVDPFWIAAAAVSNAEFERVRRARRAT